MNLTSQLNENYSYDKLQSNRMLMVRTIKLWNFSNEAYKKEGIAKLNFYSKKLTREYLKLLIIKSRCTHTLYKRRRSSKLWSIAGSSETGFTFSLLNKLQRFGTPAEITISLERRWLNFENISGEKAFFSHFIYHRTNQ